MDPPDAREFAERRPGSLRQLRRFVVLACAGFALIVSLGIGFWIWQERQRAVDQAIDTTMGFTATLRAYTSQTVANIDTTLRAVAAQAARHNALNGALLDDVATLLETSKATNRHISNLVLIDARGRVLHATAGAAELVGADLHEREYFTVHAEGSATSIRIGRPFQSRLVAPGQWRFPISYGLKSRSGEFLGVAVAMLAPEAMAREYERQREVPGLSMTLMYLDGTVISRSPYVPQDIGKVIPSFARYQGNPPERASFVIVSQVGPPVRRIISQLRLQDYPLLVSATLTEESALAGWRGSLPIAAALWGVIMAAILLAGRFGLHQITERKRLDDELRKHREQLEELVHERTAELREAQRIGHMGHWRWDIASGKIAWSDEIFRIFGYAPGAFDPTYERFMLTVHSDDVQLVQRSEQDVLSKRARHSVDHRIVLPGGEVRWVHEEAVAAFDSDGRPTALAGTVQDITERKEVEEALIEAREAAEAANLAKSSFLSSMSHEVRTPLNAVLGYAQLLRMERRASPNVLNNAAEIEKAGRHLLALVNDILDLARIESGRLEMIIEDVALAEILADCRKLVESQAQARGMALELPQARAVLRADRVRLTQALLNLLSNAVKYNSNGGRIAVREEAREGGRWRISITDTGPGIPAARIGELFQPFNRLGAEGGSIEGTGIGLVITKTLIESMAGNIGVDSVEGLGSTFWIELPPGSSVNWTI